MKSPKTKPCQTRFYDLWQIQFNILPQISHTFYRIKRNNEVLFLLTWLFEILNIALYGVMGSIVNKSTMFSKQSLIRQRNKILIESCFFMSKQTAIKSEEKLVFCSRIMR